ncbi:MAG TPA: chemotaxis protein CheW [Terriglobales bacterium]|nr:chemotaxis protein CheW [Terriglobales bacterium]
MRIVRAETRKRVHHGEPMILFAVGGTTFAIAAAEVDEIRDLSGLEPLHPAHLGPKFAKFKHTLQRDGRTYFVVDANTHFRVLPTRHTRLLVLRGAPAAVLVDAIDRMTEIASLRPLPKAFAGEERDWYRGLALLKEDVVPVVAPGAFLSKAEGIVLKAALEKQAAKGAVAG